jgi:formamidopyrimidine-DNA glycosylase
MPELPEVERVRLSLLPYLVGSRVTKATLHRADICESFERSPKGVTKTWLAPQALLAGDTIIDLQRHGKQLAIIGASGRVLTVHLGMSGQLLWKRTGEKLPATHVHAQWQLTDSAGSLSGKLVFRDPRRFGGLWTFDSFESLQEARWSQLGPDALSVTPQQLADGLRKTTRSIKAALLDQGVIAGVGNIYADEALFLAGLRPRRWAGRLKAPEIAKLAAAIREVLQQSIETGGSTLRDYVDADGRRGTAQEGHAVYGRGGKPCRRCGHPLKHALVAQRTTVWCSRCQK